MEYDVIVVGGGITGAGILRDCALRGLRAILIEKGDPGRGTTASSTHLIHGGLRYLLYDRLTTHTTCWDSGNIVRIARPLLTRLPLLWPVYRNHRHGIETVETLMESYDAFSRMKEGLPHLRLSTEETLQLVPGLKKEGLVGAVSFDEWWVDPVQLVQSNLSAAKAAGAEIRTNCTVVGFLKMNNGQPVVNGVTVRDASGKTGEIRAKIVINAAGPWVDKIARLAGPKIPLRLRKGSHLVYDRELLKTSSASRPIGLLLEAEDRGRYVFVISIAGNTLVGPTDLPSPEDPDALSTPPEDIRYLLASAKRYFLGFPEDFDRTIVGARPILGQSGNEKLLSREYEILDHETRDGLRGLITPGGGKMSDFRLMAQDAVDLACSKLGKVEACRTAQLALDGTALPPQPNNPMPSRSLKGFLRRHPHLRELHALAHLGIALGNHYKRKLFGDRRTTTSSEFLDYYSQH